LAQAQKNPPAVIASGYYRFAVLFRCWERGAYVLFTVKTAVDLFMVPRTLPASYRQKGAQLWYGGLDFQP
jgi:hypothetical protein